MILSNSTTRHTPHCKQKLQIPGYQHRQSHLWVGDAGGLHSDPSTTIQHLLTHHREITKMCKGHGQSETVNKEKESQQNGCQGHPVES